MGAGATLLHLHQRGRQRTEENERPCFTVDLFGEMRTLLVSFRIVKESFEIAKNRDGAERSLRWCQDNAPCCSKASVRFQFSEQREILLTALRGISFCSSGRGTIETLTSTPSGRCTMRNRDFVSEGFLAIIAASLVLLCS